MVMHPSHTFSHTLSPLLLLLIQTLINLLFPSHAHSHRHNVPQRPWQMGPGPFHGGFSVQTAAWFGTVLSGQWIDSDHYRRFSLPECHNGDECGELGASLRRHGALTHEWWRCEWRSFYWHSYLLRSHAAHLKTWRAIVRLHCSKSRSFPRPAYFLALPGSAIPKHITGFVLVSAL